MSIKKEYLFLLAIIIAASLYLYVKDTNRINYKLPELAKLNPADVDTIEISRPSQDKLVLKKQDDRWRIQPEGYLADEKQVDKMLTAASTLTVSTLVATSAEYSRYGLDPKDAISVNIGGKSGAVSRRFDIGKKATSYNHTFVKIADDSNVYHAEGRLKIDFDKSASSLRDKTVLTFDPADIHRIVIANQGETLSFKKQPAPADQTGDASKAAPEAVQSGAQPKMVWLTAQGKTADDSAITALLKGLSALKCQTFLPKGAKDGLTDPVYTITVSGTDEHKLSLFPVNAGDEPKNYQGVSSDVASAFVLTKSTAAEVMKTQADLTAAPAKKAGK